MVVFLNTRITENKRLVLSLQKVFGIGFYRADKAVKLLGYNENSKVFFNDLSPIELKIITDFFVKKYIFGYKLKQLIKNKLKQYILFNMYKGYRLQRGLPLRGQRTQTNASTIKKLKSKLLNFK